MVPFEDNPQSFPAHLDSMKTFRLSQHPSRKSEPPITKRPAPYEIDLSPGQRLAVYLPTPEGVIIFIPIWKIPSPENFQN